MNPICSDIICAIKNTITKKGVLNLHEPVFKGNEKKYLIDCIDTGYVSSVGEYVTRFEKMVSLFTGAAYAVAVTNGTAALHIALKLANVFPNDEVLVPALTFVATANAVTYCRAVPHFIDSDPANLGIDVVKLGHYLKETTDIRNKTCINKQTGNPIRAIVAVHVFGMPVDIDPLKDLCTQYHLQLVEDAAESLGSYYKGTHTGNFGVAAALSFNGNKTITTGGGGVILCNNKETAVFAKHITTTARVSIGFNFSHDHSGFNYRMPNLNAALGCAQMELLPSFLKQKRSLSEKYAASFSSVKGVSLLKEPDYVKSNFWLNTLLLDKPDDILLETILEETNSTGIQTRPVWTLLHKLPMYKECPSMNLDCAIKLEKRIINLPSSADLLD